MAGRDGEVSSGVQTLLLRIRDTEALIDWEVLVQMIRGGEGRDAASKHVEEEDQAQDFGHCLSGTI